MKYLKSKGGSLLKLNATLYFIVTLSLGSAPLYAKEAQATETLSEQKKIEILQSLAKANYFRHATCTEVANTFLEDSGLPALGKNSAIQGQRGNFDRSQANTEPPQFKDEITRDGVKTIFLAETKKSGPSKIWNLKILRQQIASQEKSKGELVTSMQFEVPGGKDSFYCEMIHLNLQPHTKEEKIISVGLDDCLELFLYKDKLAGQQKQIEDWVKKDCAMSLHYSKEAHIQTIKRSK